MIWEIGGVDARERLIGAVNHAARRYNTEPPSAEQIALVLHALADHTTMMDALNFANSPESAWPEMNDIASASSVGRFMHAYGDYFDAHRRTQELRG